MTPKFDYVLRAATSDPQGTVQRKLTCDNCGWVVEVCDDNVESINIDAKAWKRQVRDDLARRKSIVKYHKLATIIEAYKSQFSVISSSAASASSSAGRSSGASGAASSSHAGSAATGQGANAGEGGAPVNCKSINFYGVIIGEDATFMPHSHAMLTLRRPHQTRGSNSHAQRCTKAHNCSPCLRAAFEGIA